jgi:antitoxin YefM
MKMVITKQMNLRTHIKHYFDLAFSGEPVFVARKKNENVVVISQSDFEEYQRLQKEKNNAEYIAMLKQSMAEAEAGGFIAKTIEELEACEK